VTASPELLKPSLRAARSRLEEFVDRLPRPFGHAITGVFGEELNRRQPVDALLLDAAQVFVVASGFSDDGIDVGPDRAVERGDALLGVGFEASRPLLRGCDVDKPRNLAKSVTVE